MRIARRCAGAAPKTRKNIKFFISTFNLQIYTDLCRSSEKYKKKYQYLPQPAYV